MHSQGTLLSVDNPSPVAGRAITCPSLPQWLSVGLTVWVPICWWSCRAVSLMLSLALNPHTFSGTTSASLSFFEASARRTRTDFKKFAPLRMLVCNFSAQKICCLAIRIGICHVFAQLLFAVRLGLRNYVLFHGLRIPSHAARL